MIITIIAFIICIWFLLAFLIPLLILPNHLLIKTKIQHTKKIKTLAKKLKAKNKEQTLKNVYNYTTKTYTGIKEKYKLANYPKLFLYNVDKLLNKKQFLACHIQNLVIITLLLNTNQFKEKDIQRKETITKFLTVHQHLIITINNQKYKIDPFFRVLTKKT